MRMRLSRASLHANRQDLQLSDQGQKKVTETGDIAAII